MSNDVEHRLESALARLADTYVPAPAAHAAPTRGSRRWLVAACLIGVLMLGAGALQLRSSADSGFAVVSPGTDPDLVTTDTEPSEAVVGTDPAADQTSNPQPVAEPSATGRAGVDLLLELEAAPLAVLDPAFAGEQASADVVVGAWVESGVYGFDHVGIRRTADGTLDAAVGWSVVPEHAAWRVLADDTDHTLGDGSTARRSEGAAIGRGVVYAVELGEGSFVTVTTDRANEAVLDDWLPVVLEAVRAEAPVPFPDGFQSRPMRSSYDWVSYRTSGVSVTTARYDGPVEIDEVVGFRNSFFALGEQIPGVDGVMLVDPDGREMAALVRVAPTIVASVRSDAGDDDLITLAQHLVMSSRAEADLALPSALGRIGMPYSATDIEFVLGETVRGRLAVASWTDGGERCSSMITDHWQNIRTGAQCVDLGERSTSALNAPVFCGVAAIGRGDSNWSQTVVAIVAEGDGSGILTVDGATVAGSTYPVTVVGGPSLDFVSAEVTTDDPLREVPGGDGGCEWSAVPVWPPVGAAPDAEPDDLVKLVLEGSHDGLTLISTGFDIDVFDDGRAYGLARYETDTPGVSLDIMTQWFPGRVDTPIELGWPTWEIDGRTVVVDNQLPDCCPDYRNVSFMWDEGTAVSVSWRADEGTTLGDEHSVDALVDLVDDLVIDPQPWDYVDGLLDPGG